MAIRLRKTRKMRGSHTHGYGSKKKHRGGGSHGGKGYADTEDHKISYVLRKAPRHLGYKGFVPKNTKETKVINLIDVNRIALASTSTAGKAEEKIKINLRELGFDKLLATGKLTRPVDIIVESFSKSAKEKVEASGGSITSTS